MLCVTGKLLEHQAQYDAQNGKPAHNGKPTHNGKPAHNGKLAHNGKPTHNDALQNCLGDV